MLPFFPDPHPDELLYSVFSRYHLWSGNGNFRQTQDDLFGCRSAKPVFDLPSRIDALVECLPQRANYSSEEFIQNNTLYPYYAAFLPQERADRVFSDMKGDRGGSIHMRTGIMAGGICNILGLRYCSTCVRTDYETYGEAYWHRTHQAPGVFVCPKHSVYLLCDCLECGENLSDSHIQEYKALNLYCSNDHKLTESSITRPFELPKQLEFRFLALAKDIDYLLKNNLDSFNPNKLREIYINLLQRMNLASISGRIHVREVTEQFIANFTPEFLSCVESGLDPTDDYSWLAAAFRKPRKVTHPIRHLLIMQFLSGSLEGFIAEMEFKYKPFGDGPWPCLNPVNSHFKKAIVKDLKITRCTDTRLPVGTFRCKCGFAYSRKGPDKTPKDKFRIGRIKSFGSVWEKRLKEVVSDGHLGLRGIARAMQADPGTVKKYLSKIRFEDDISFIDIQTSTVDTSILKSNDSTLHTAMQMLENRRQKMLNVSRETDMFTRTQIRQRIPGIFTWLYRHDREWLNSVLPLPNPRKSNPNARVNWEHRDELLSQKVKEAVEELLLRDEKPVRITLSKIGRCINELAILEQHLDRLPKTKSIIDEVVETLEDFQIRRVHWVVRELKNMGEEVVEWKVIRCAGLHSDISESVKQALQYELSQLTLEPIYSGRDNCYDQIYF